MATTRSFSSLSRSSASEPRVATKRSPRQNAALDGGVARSG
jgi:hypothetical protein